MKKFILFVGVLIFSFVGSSVNAVNLGIGPKYGGWMNKDKPLTFARGGVLEVKLLGVEKDSTGQVKFKMTQELSYVEFDNHGDEEQMLSSMTYGLIPIFKSVWAGLGTGFYNVVKTDANDVKAPSFGLKASASWKGYVLNFQGEAIQVDGPDNYFVGLSLTRAFK